MNARDDSERRIDVVARTTRPLLRDRWVQAVALAWILALGVVILLANGSLPLDRPLLDGVSMAGQLVNVNIGLIEVLILMALVTWMTRHRNSSPIVTAATAGVDVRRETRVLVTYGALALLGGIALGQALDMHPISFHLAGTLFGSHDHDLVSPRETAIWAGYNLVAYVIVPLLWLGRRANHDRLLLRSHDRRGDFRVIVAVLVIESLAQLGAVSDALFDLSARQVLLGAPLTFGLYAIGTVLPTLIFVQALLVPRFFALTGSVPRAVILGGLTYAAMHFPEAWMSLTSPGNTTLSLVFLMFTYFAPGMMKTTLTLRTGNAWVHAWAYHAIAPHTLLDTPLIVRIFGIR